MNWRKVNWSDYAQVEEYLLSMDKPQIPNEAWMSMQSSMKIAGDIDYDRYKREYFREVVEDKDGNLKRKRIYYNILKKYMFSLYPIIKPAGDNKGILVWTGKYYREEYAKDFLNLFLEDHVLEESNEFGLQTAEMETFRQNCLTMVSMQKRDIYRQQRHLLNFQNGFLDTRTMEFKDHTSNIPFTYVMDYSYTQDNEDTKNWDKMLNLITIDREHLNRTIEFYVGFILSQDSTNRFQYFLLLSGSGENGKSFLIETLQAMLSEELYTVQKVEKMNKERFATSSIEGKVAIFTDEEDKSVFEKSNFLKELVGGNQKISIERKYADAYEIDAVAKPIISTNHMPYLGDTTHGFIRRLLVLPLDLDIKKMTKKEMIEKLLPPPEVMSKIELFGKEFPAIMRKCLSVYRDCLQNGFELPKEVKDLQLRLIRKSNHLLNWMEENLVYTGRDNDKIPARFIYDLYCDEIETGKYNKKKLGNFCDELKTWIDGTKKEFKGKSSPFIGEVSTGRNQRYSVLLDREAQLLDVYDEKYEMSCDYDSSERFVDKQAKIVLIGYMMKQQYLLNFPDTNGVID